MLCAAVEDIEDLPGIQLALNAANQIRAHSYFNAVFTYSTTDVELVSKCTTGMYVSFNVEFGAWAPFILVYAVN